MVLIRFASVVAAASLLLSVAADDTPTTTIKDHITTPSVIIKANAMVDIGCYATGTPLENHGDYLYRSPGNCQLVCLSLGKDVMGLSDGENCWCGDMLPSKQWKVDNSSCNTQCRGDDTSLCGGNKKIWVVLTGKAKNAPDTFEPSSSLVSKTSSATPTSAAPIKSPSSSPTSTSNDENKPNTAGIAAGVVVGIVGLGAIVVAVWWILRRRRQKQAEADYRRNAANVDQFVAGGKLHTSNSSMNDSRIDPSFIDRRQSNGSIADNEDYSRRILKVTNV